MGKELVLTAIILAQLVMEDRPIIVLVVIQATIAIFQVHLVSALILSMIMVRVVPAKPVIQAALAVFLLLDAPAVTHLNFDILGIQVLTVYVWTDTIILERRLAVVAIQLATNVQVIQ